MEESADRPSFAPHQTTDVSQSANLGAAPLQARQRVEVPVVQEQVSIDKKKVEVGQVVVHVEPHIEREIVDVPLMEETVEVRRVPVNRVVSGPVQVRQEGDVTIVPVFEEVLVVEKRLMLKEEIHLVRRKSQTREQQAVELKKEEAHVLRAGGQGA